MKVIAVYGSPRMNGNCNTLLKEAVKGARDAGHEVVEYVLNDMFVKGCQGCASCRKSETFCVVNDDLKPYWEQVKEAGALMVSAPNYCSLLAGPVITYMNRHYCIFDKDYHSRWEPGKKIVGIFSQGWDKEDAYLDRYDHFLGDFQARGMVRHALIVHAGKTPAAERTDLMERAYKAGNTL